MVPIPPPPDHGSTTPPPPPPPPGPDRTATFPRPGELTIGWRWVLTLGWAAVVVGLIAVADAARVLHKPPFWIDAGALFLVPFVPTVAAAVAAFANHRWAVWVGGVAVGVLAVSGVIDRSGTPGVAAALGVLAAIGALTTVAALAGRMPRPRP